MSKPFCESGSLPSAGAALVRAYTVGVTGSIATGKSAVGKILQERHGAFVVDTDHITRELLDHPCPAYDEVLAHFGADLAPVKDGPIDRALLKARAFATVELKAELEAILHPRIYERLESLILEQSAAGVKVVFILVPLLHETGMQENFDEVWCVVAREDVRLARLMARNGLTEDVAKKMIGLQMTQTEKAKLSQVIIDNSFDLETTAGHVKTAVEALIGRVDQYYATATATPATDGDASVEAPAAEGTDAEVTDSNAAPEAEGGNAEVTDSDAAPEAEGGNADAAGKPDANARYRKILRQAAETGADETLAKLGDVSTTAHQEATARMSLVVDRATDGEPDLSRQLDVEVKMTVRNKPGSTPTPGACSCGCGDRCRVDCACMPDCGCGCKKPVPPPPVPPVDEDGKPSKRDNRVLFGLFGLLGLLAFLFACLVLWSWNHQPKVVSGGSSVTVINNLPGCGDCGPKEPPVVVPPVVVPPVVEPPFNPPAAPPSCPPGVKQELDEVPGWAFRFVHNVVRERVARWEVSYGEACRGSIVKGFDADKRLLVYQEYDSHQYMTFQYVMTYGTDGSTQVDRFEGRGNIFTGRSIYRVNTLGSVVRAEHYSGLKKPVYIVTFVRNGSGGVAALNVEEFDALSGAAIPKKVIDGKVAAGEFLQEKFYVFNWFCQL